MRGVALHLPIVLIASAFMASPSAMAGNRTVKVGVYENPPKVFTDESGRPAGIFIDVIEHIAGNEGWNLEFVPGTFEEGLKRLEAGEIDLMPDVALTEDRTKQFAFHKVPVLSSWSQVYARDRSGIRSILDLNGKSVAVLEGSVQHEAFAQLAHGFGLRIKLVSMPDYPAMFKAAAEGKIDAVIANNYFGIMNAPRFGLKDTSVVFQPASLYFAAPLHAAGPLTDRIDHHMRDLREDSQSVYYISLKRWTSEDVEFQLPAWIKVMGLCAGIVLLMSLAGSVVLKRQVNARTRALSERTEQIIAMDKALRSTTTELNLQQILDRALQGALSLTRLDGGVLCLLDKETGRLVPRASVGSSGAAGNVPIRDPRSLGDCIWDQGSFAGKNRAAWERSVGPKPGGCGLMRREGILSSAAFPLRVHDKTIGTLCLFSLREESPEKNKLDLVEDICAPVALAIENAMLFDEAKRHEGELAQQVAERTNELARALERALAADCTKTAFLATMSHELRTPLNAIIGFTGILLKELAGPLNEEQHKQMGMVQSSSRHLLSLINDVLDISKIEAGQLELHAGPFALRPSIEKIAAMVSPLAGKKGIELRTVIADDVGDITADQRRLEQIVLNLLNNAVKFTDKGHVRISCSRVGDEYSLSVSDTGIGIRREDMADLFKPFHQVDSGIARKHEGTGLGLSICRKLLDMMGGGIRVESQPGLGSEFTVRFPCHSGAHS